MRNAQAPEAWEVWEQNVPLVLERYGWDVEPWGQGRFAGSFRLALSGSPTATLRFVPDWIAVRSVEDHRDEALVDAKSDSLANANSRYHAVNADAVQANLGMARWLPLFYIWPDGGLATPRHLISAGQLHLSNRDCWCGHRHRSAYYAIERSACLRTDQTLGGSRGLFGCSICPHKEPS